MVFESLVVELVNKYLGDFIENLDKSQLKIGIWGGDVVLNNLFVKESALDDLDLPIKVLHGNIGKLVLKIPWKNLYTEPVTAQLEGLYVVAVPNKDGGKTYVVMTPVVSSMDTEKEDKAAQEKKQKELARIEEAKKQEAEKNKPKKEKSDSFAEKMATQIIKNLQVTVRDIHIRYEDQITNPKKPFSIGVTLKGLFFQTTDENWKPTVIKDTVTKIYKMIKLDSLAAYWNCNTQSYLKLDREKIHELLTQHIAVSGQKTDYQYLIEPISSTAQLCLHPHPEQDKYTIPKVLLNVIFEQIGIALSKSQFQDVLELLESFERMNIGSRYRKYRPDVPLPGHSKLWWRFAYNCILEETVRRRRRMWSWDHIKKHRQMRREYKEAYKQKLINKKVNSKTQKVLDDCEKELDVFNITMIRQQAEVESKSSMSKKERKEMKKKEKAAKKEAKKQAKKEGAKKAKEKASKGWFGGWFGGGSKETKETKEKAIGDQFQELMTAEEKAKLYEAIGYQENAVDPTLPKEFEAMKMNFKLQNLSLKLNDTDLQKPEVVSLQLTDVFSAVAQRPAANAIKVDARVDTLSVFGSPVPDTDHRPKMVSSQNLIEDRKYTSLLEAQFETNPLDGKCDTKVAAQARPLEIIYDARTINQVVEFFKPPDTVHLKQLQAAAVAKLDEIKEQTATGLQHAIEQHKYTDISVHLEPTYVLVPETGTYKEGARMVVLDLGKLSIGSEKQEAVPSSPTGEMLQMEEVMKRAYDKFNISLQSVQLLFVQPGEDWKAARTQAVSHMHILRPMRLDINLFKCMIQDYKMPKMKVKGELPNLTVSISDHRLQQILELVQSIPFPESAPAPPEDEFDYDAPDISTLAQVDSRSYKVLKKMSGEGVLDTESSSSGDEAAEGEKTVQKPPVKPQMSQEHANATDMELKFEVMEISLVLMQYKDGVEHPVAKVVVDSLGTEVKIRTFDMIVDAYLGGVYVQHMQFKALNDGPLINLVNTPVSDDSTCKLLEVQYLKANKKGPDFATTYKNIEQKISVHFRGLEVLLHQEAILNLMEFATALQPPPKPASPEPAKSPSTTASSSPKKSDEVAAAPKRARRRRKQDEEVIDIAVEAKLDVFSVAVCTQSHLLTDVKIKGLEAKVAVMKTKITVETGLKDIVVYNPTPNALYPKILCVEGGEVFRVDLAVFNGATDGENYSNMDAVDTKVDLNFGCMKVIFLNKFVMDLLGFLDQFQAAKDKMAEASSAAAASAAAAAQDLSQKSARIALNIKMKAPVIVVPQNSQSTNALVADLGTLSLSNSFSMVEGARSVQGMPAILDKLAIELTSLKVLRTLYTDDRVVAECRILEPVNIRLAVTRNLAASWYRAHPDIEIAGKLEAFSAGLSQGDFSMLMHLLNENLTEGQKPGPAPPAVSGQTTASSSPTSQQTVPSTEPATATPTTTPAAVATEVYPKMKFDFQIETINATLYNGDSNLNAGGYQARDKTKALARFELKKIAVNGKMLSDNSMNAHVILHNMVLEDSRPGRETGIIRLIERAGIAPGAQAGDMVEVNFEQSADQSKNIAMTVNTLYICLVVDHLMQLADFFTKGLPQAPAQAPAPAPAPKDRGDAVPKPATEAAKPMEGEITVTLKVMKPEIIMVEDAMNYNTNALILDTDVSFKLHMSAQSQTMMGAIKALQIVSCIYAPDKRASTKTQILNPCDINLVSNAPNGKGHHMDLQVTDIGLNISPATIRTLTATLSGLNPQQKVEDKDSLADIPKDLWFVRNIKDCDFWFLKTVVPEDGQPEAAATLLPPPLEEPVPSRGEQLMLSVGRIVVKMEGGVGHRTVPLLITEMTFRGEVKDWSSKLYVSSEVSIEVAYYNERLAVWEPLLEPVEAEGKHRPWELNMEVVQNDDLPPLPDEDEPPETVHLPPSKMVVTIMSSDILQLTVTKSCLEVLNNLGKSFGDAYNLVEITEKPGEVVTPYLVKNDTGLAVTLKLDETFKMPQQAANMHVGLMPGDHLPLSNSESEEKALAKRSIIKNTQEDQIKRMHVIVEEFGATRELKVVKAEKRAFNINNRAYPGETWSMVCQTDAVYGCKVVTLRSMLQIHNHLPVSMEVYYKLGNDAMGRCGEIHTDQTLNVPLEAVYAAPYELYFKPLDPNYDESRMPLAWRELTAGSSTIVSCGPSKTGQLPFHFSVHPVVEDILLESTGAKTAKSFTLNLHPCAVIKNMLPIPFSYGQEGMGEDQQVQGGEKRPLLNAKVGSTYIHIKMMYMGKEWRAKKLLDEKPQDLSILTFDREDNGTIVSMDLGMHCQTSKGYQELSVYCPYWMINRTGRNLAYKAGDEAVIGHPPEIKDAVLFSFKSKSFFGKKKEEEESEKRSSLSRKSSFSRRGSGSPSPKKKNKKLPKRKSSKAALKVGESEWSDKFSLDTVGSSGTVACKFKGFVYEVGVKITLSNSGLTKIVEFTPYYMLMNQASFTVSCRENINEAHWCDVPPGECVPFWPMGTEKKMQMVAKVKDKDLETKPFYFNEVHTTLMALPEYGGLTVDCQVLEAAITVTLQQYQPGMASALLINHTTNCTVDYSQSGVKTQDSLGPGECILYTWQDATAKRELVWTCGEKKNQKDDLVKDGIGELFKDPDTKVYWVSFLDGMQRVLMFTEDLALATTAQQAGELERVEQEIVLQLQGMGLSLVNNYLRKEVCYMGITSSGIIWEERRKKRFRALKNKHNKILEDAYQHYLNELAVGGKGNPKPQLESKLEVDFSQDPIQMFKPRKCAIRRSFESGIWAQYRTSPHQLQFHAKIHRLQLDNQTSGAVFPTVLAPMPPPKSVAAESVPKPFTEMSVMLRKKEHTSVMEFKYAKILVQEMTVKVDQGFLNALITLFESEKVTEEEEKQLYQEDCKVIQRQLKDEAVKHSTTDLKNYYDMLHVSPLKIHLSFSLYGDSGDAGKPTQLKSNVINLFLQSVGIVLTDIQDVIFKLGYFERKHRFYNQSQLTGEIVRHYSGQAIKQMYVLVLGLDVLGNPFGVIRGLAEGIEDLFYEPYQGAIQGPEEFAEGLALGVRSLFGHAVGGAAGAVSRITGALGKGIATLTFDDDYQKKRREQLNKRPANFKEGMARGGKGLVMGVVDGVTGIVTKPMEGAKQEGVEGFFKGMGKGLVGVFTRPASGVVDFASSSFEGIRRVAEMSDEVHKLRPARFLHTDGIVRPYVHREAEGNGILQDMEKGRYSESDVYVAHVVVTKDMKNVLLCTDKRVAFASKGDIFGHWDCDWQYVWAELKEAPSLTAKGVQILLKEKQKKSFFSSGTVGKMIPIADRKLAEWIVEKMRESVAKAK